MLKTVSPKITELFGIDLRSLALFRMGIALLIVIDLLNRAEALKAHYTDFGVLPRFILIEKYIHQHLFSFHFFNGLIEFQAFLFIVAGLLAVALFFGFHTRFVTIASWVLLVSLHTRNPMVLQAGDTLLRVLVFWAMFLPLGARYSIDSLVASRPQLPRYHLSFASVAILAQLCYMYVFTYFLKDGFAWKSGQAVYLALQLDSFRTSFGNLFLPYTDLLELLSYGTIYLEGFGPLLLFVPFFTAPLRILVIFSFIGLHLGIASMMELGLFSYISITGWFLFLPSPFWTTLRRLWDTHGAPRFLPPTRLESLNTFKQQLYQSSRYFYRNPQHEEAPVLWLHFCKLFRISVHGFVLLCFIYVTLWNIRTLDFDHYRKYFPPKYNWFGYALHIDQYWNMFSPNPTRESGWFIAHGRLRDGTSIDLFRDGAPLTWEKPELVSALFPNQRWRKYMENLWSRKFKDRRLYYGKYLCRSWNKKHRGNEQLMGFKLHYMLEMVQFNYQPTKPTDKRTLWSHSCFKK